MCRRIPRIAAVWCCAAALGGCSGMPLLTQPIASYGEANAFAPAGYSQTKVDGTHYQVRATGTEATPRQRVEKIARARAAQIGVEEKLRYFKVASVQHAVRCSKRQGAYKSTELPAGEPADGCARRGVRQGLGRPFVRGHGRSVRYPEQRARRRGRGRRGQNARRAGDPRRLRTELTPSQIKALDASRPAHFSQIGDEAIKTLRIAGPFV